MEPYTGYFTAPLAESDPEVAAAIAAELARQNDQIELIASENVVSVAVLEAQGSVFTNKTVEGYPGARYYGGAEHADTIERLAIERARRLFGCGHANVQPHSGSQANHAVFLAFVKPGECVLAMALAAGGHLSHGAPPNLTGKWFNAVPYGVRRQDSRIDYDEVARLAEAHRPRLIIAGGSAYPRVIDFARFREIADAVAATLLVDMAHFAGLVAAGLYPNPFPHAHVVTTTTYKNLRGARGGLILADDPEIGKKLDSANFPGVQGSVMLHAVAGKAVALGEALRPDFRVYAKAVLDNARTLAATLEDGGYDIVSGGTDTPLMLVDLRAKGLTGEAAATSLERAGIACNKNAIPFDPKPPRIASGLRLGTSAGTTRGFRGPEFARIGELIGEVLHGLATKGAENHVVEAAVRAEVTSLCRRFPIYGLEGA